MLKKLTVISLIALLVFNWYGYRLLINYFENEASIHLQAKLDKDQYDESSLIQLRVPLNMPYITDWDQFENYEGETEINGIHYKYVKRKIEKGELVLLCIPNQQKTQLQTASHNFFKLANDLQQPGAKKDSKGPTVKLSFTDYIANPPFSATLAESNAVAMHPHYSFFVPTIHLSAPTQPPDC